MRKWLITIVTAVCLAGTAAAQSGDTVSQFIKTRAPIIAILNIEVIDGTGTSVLTGQTVLIDHGKIATVGPTAQVTGHLCSVGFNEAVEMGIDNLEHGPFAAPDGELYSQKKRGVCGSGVPGASRADVGRDIVSKVDPDGPELKQTIQLMVRHNVPLTSTLAVYESSYVVRLTTGQNWQPERRS